MMTMSKKTQQKTLPQRIRQLTVAATAFVLVACGTTTVRAPFDERYAEELRPYQDLKLQKAELWEIGQEPQTFEVKEQGKVTVRHWALQGCPGKEYVKTKITFENTTDKALRHAVVWLEVLDSDGKVRGSSAARLTNPLGYRLWPKHTVTTELRAPTHGAHKDTEGWFWRIDVKGLVSSDSSPKPERFLSREENRGFRPMMPRPGYRGPGGYSRYSSYSSYSGGYGGYETPGITNWWR